MQNSLSPFSIFYFFFNNYTQAISIKLPFVFEVVNTSQTDVKAFAFVLFKYQLVQFL